MLSEHLHSNAKLSPRILLLLILGAAFIGWDFGQLGGLVTALAVVSTTALVLLYLLPESPFVILVMGMSIWTLAPSPISAFVEGFAIPLTLFLALLAAILRLLLNTGRTHRVRLGLADFSMMLFTAWMWIALLWSQGKGYGQFKALGFTAFTLSAYLIIRFGFRSQGLNLRRMAWLMVLAAMGHAAIVFYIAAQGGIWLPTQNLALFGHRIRELGLNFIAEADALTLGLIATLALLLTSKRSHRGFLILAYLLQLWAFMYYQQRGATLALIAATTLVVYYLAEPPQRVKNLTHPPHHRGTGLALLLIPVVAVILLVFNPQFEISGLSTDINVVSRLEFYSWSWDLFLDNPLSGVGTGATGALIEGPFAVSNFYVHNRFLEILSELGLIGITLFLLLSLALLRSFLATVSKRLNQGVPFGLVLVSSALLARYVVGMFSSDLVGWNIGVWSGLLVTMYEQSQVRSKEMPTNVWSANH